MSGLGSIYGLVGRILHMYFIQAYIHMWEFSKSEDRNGNVSGINAAGAHERPVGASKGVLPGVHGGKVWGGVELF